MNRKLQVFRLFAVVALLLSVIAAPTSAAPAAPDSGWATSVTINSPTTANPAYINPDDDPFTVDFAAGGTGNGRVWAQVGYNSLNWGSNPVWDEFGTFVTFPHTQKRDIWAGCAEGVYDVGVWAQGQSQTTWLSTTQPNAAVVDCTDPVVPANPLIAPNGGENLTLGSIFNVTWDPTKITDANLGPNPISLYLDCIIGGVPLPQTRVASGLPVTPGSFTWTVGGAVGACMMTLRATDLAGNNTQGTSLNTFTISGLDPSAPAPVTLLTPLGATTPNWTWLKGGPYNFTANASDPQSGVKTVEFFVSSDLGVTYPFVNAATSGPSPYAYSWDTAGLPEDTELWVQAKATNGLDAFAYSAINKRIKVDNTPPNANAITAPALNANVKGTVNVVAHPDDLAAGPGTGSGLAQVLFEYSLNNGTTWLPLGTDTTASVTGDWSWAWDTMMQFPAGQQGNAWLRATAKDNVGWTARTAVVPVAVDNKVPVKTEPFLTSPNGGEVWQIGVDHNITWDHTKIADSKAFALPTALDPNPVTLSYSTDGTTWKVIATGAAVNFNADLYTWSAADSAGLLPSASYVLKIEVKDLAGNTASDVSNAFTFWNNDATPPTVSRVTAVAPLTSGFAKGTVNVTGQGLDLQSGVQAIRFQVSLNNGPIWTAWTDIGAAPSLTYNYATKLWTGSVAWNTGSFSGQALLRAIAKNGVGNEVVLPDPAFPDFPVSVDNSKPALAWDAGYASQCVASGSVFPIGVQAVESPQTSMVKVKFDYSLDGGTTWRGVNGPLVGPDPVDSGTVFGTGPGFAINWDITGLRDGPAVLRATAWNGVNLTSMISNRFVYIKKNGAAVSPQVTCLVSGWNLYSSPLVLNDANMAPIGTVLAGPVGHGSLIQVRTFQGADVAPKAWFPATGTGDIDYIKDGQGYWLHMSAPDVLAVVGTERPGPATAPRAYSVFGPVADVAGSGWNMIGFTSVNPRPVHTADNTGYLDPAVFATVSAMYGYDRDTQSYGVVFGADNLQPSQGYWLAVNANGTIFP